MSKLTRVKLKSSKQLNRNRGLDLNLDQQIQDHLVIKAQELLVCHPLLTIKRSWDNNNFKSSRMFKLLNNQLEDLPLLNLKPNNNNNSSLDQWHNNVHSQDLLLLELALLCHLLNSQHQYNSNNSLPLQWDNLLHQQRNLVPLQLLKNNRCRFSKFTSNKLKNLIKWIIKYKRLNSNSNQSRNKNNQSNKIRLDKLHLFRDLDLQEVNLILLQDLELLLEWLPLRQLHKLFSHRI